MNDPTTELLLRVNGIPPAFGIEFGLESPRADEGRTTNPYRQANVSYSLAQKYTGRYAAHTSSIAYGCRAIALGIRAHPWSPLRPTRFCSPIPI